MAQLSVHDKAVLNCIFNPNLPLDQVYDEELSAPIKDIEEETPETEKSKELEVEGVRKAEDSKLDEAINLINAAIRIAPNRASPYNNRAQINQLLGNLTDAFNDLTKAIELGKDEQQRTTCQALCQRGLLYRKEGKIDLAREDFNEAAKLGSHFAKNQLIELNPYAALCNQMLRQAFENLQ
ncbi:hypothetical protein ILUMI_12465 [Ignelater luminosus]|uniref:Tetratricopeptide repeat protein 36 n=1 Tax=Ignelater luminosus TaxID=2038154 RepID=A0A8K0CU34_IGNLU|nr:hypothetical protein ILUMI_12465 [Ignelater luminosus]